LRTLGGEGTELIIPCANDEDDRGTWNFGSSDYALDREIELARLEKENEELRRMMGLVAPQQRRNNSDTRPVVEPPPRSEAQRASSTSKLSGVSGTGGPYKTMRSPG